MPSFSLRPRLVLCIGVITGCILVLWTLPLVPAQEPEAKGKHTYSLQYIKLPAADGEIPGLAGCKSVSIASGCSLLLTLSSASWPRCHSCGGRRGGRRAGFSC